MRPTWYTLCYDLALMALTGYLCWLLSSGLPCLMLFLLTFPEKP